MSTDTTENPTPDVAGDGAATLGNAPAPPEPEEAVEHLPDMTPVLLDDMREGVLRYRGLAEVEDEEARKHEEAGPRCRMEARDYRAKAASLETMIRDLGYDLEDRSVSPADPEGIHP